MLTFALAVLLAQAPDYSKVEVKAQKVAGNVYVITGAGGNIGASIGDDGVALVDDQFAPLVPKLKVALAQLSKAPVRFVINTHWHGDHVGGNAQLAETAAILAHINVHKRMESGGKSPMGEIPPSPRAALPVVTFEQGISLWWNGEEIRALHPGIGHTDGDTVLWFTKSNVVHMGDDYFVGMYPFIDLDSGGSVVKLIESLDVVLGWIPAGAKVIPGHGPVTGVPELRAYRAMLDGVVGAVRKGLAAGKTVEQMQKEKVLAQWDATLGGGFIKPDMMISIVAQDLARR